MVICTQMKWPNTMIGDSWGHVDGANFTGCMVPTSVNWWTVAVLLAAAVVLAVGASIIFLVVISNGQRIASSR